MGNENFDLLITEMGLDRAKFQPEITQLKLLRVGVSEKRREWKLYFSIPNFPGIEFYTHFYQHLHNYFANKGIAADANFDLPTEIQELQTPQIYEEIWPLVASLVAHQNPNLSELITNCSFGLDNDNLVISFEREFGFDYFNQHAKEVDETFQKLGLHKFHTIIKLDTQRADNLKNQIDKEIRQSLTASLANVTTKQQEVKVSSAIGKNIPSDPKIASIHDVEEGDRVFLEGYVFQSEPRELRNGKVLGLFKITDFVDSISVKKFAGDRFTKKDSPEMRTEEKFLRDLSAGKWVRVSGKVENDSFAEEISVIADGIEIIENPRKSVIEADPETQRIELHVHTNNTSMSGLDSAGKYFERAKDWSQSAVGIMDNGSVQSYHDAFLASQKTGVKGIYGYEANFVKLNQLIAINPIQRPLVDQEYVTFDIETTGLSAIYDKVIELSAVKMKNGKILGEFQEFLNPGFPLSQQTIQLTNITDADVANSKPIEEVFDAFREFYGDAILVGHNVNFDLGFLNFEYDQQGKPTIKNPVIDTLTLSRALHPEYGKFTLDFIAKKLGIALEQHHRAIYDSIATGYIVDKLLEDAQERFEITQHDQLNSLMKGSQAWRQVRPTNLSILVKNNVGLKNLFKIVSEANVTYFSRVSRVPQNLLDRYKEGLIIGSGDLKSEFFDTLLRKGENEARSLVSYFDYIEVQPLENYDALIASGDIQDRGQVKKLIEQAYKISKQENKPLVVTGDTKFIDPYEAKYREILITSKAARNAVGIESKFHSNDLHYRSTSELLDEFSFLGLEAAKEIVVDNSHLIASWIEEVVPFKKGLSAPEIPGSEQSVIDLSYAKAHELYGENLPEIITERLEKELNAINGNGFSVIYLIFQKLVAKSNKDGYLVGSRGSVGSSLVATMLNITEVNPLPPHYRSVHGDYVEFVDDPQIASGFDLPEKEDPNHPGEYLIGDGHNIPFETFMGFDGTKVPDIDLNFSGDYQPIAHNYTKALFGEDHVFRAGTISTIAERTAIGIVKNYAEENEQKYRPAEMLRLASGITGIKRTTGQHAGGIIIIPGNKDVTDFTPIQYPSDDKSKGWQTTHFDYHSIDANVLKMDMLGHDDPTILRMLQDTTGIDPKSIPMNDPNVLSLFTSPKALGVTSEQILSKTGTYGVPEMGTKTTRSLLEETKPTKFGDLLQVSGLSHGTGVYRGNADELIRDGIATISTIIGTRDQIMSDLIKYGLDPNDAFNIMEKVRKGKGVSEEYQKLMKEHNVPAWYINSAQKIQYMFPRSHATAYVMSALRIAWFKVYYPVAYYAAYMSVRSSDITFGAEAMTKGSQAMLEKVKELYAQPKLDKPQQTELAVYEIANEAWQRGIEFQFVDLYKSESFEWKIEGNKIILPFIAVAGLGENVAKAIVAARAEHEFISKEDLKKRAGVNNTTMGELSRLHVLDGLNEENQLDLFGI